MRCGHPVGVILLMALAIRPACADRVDDVVRREMKRQHIPGCAVAIDRGGRAERPRTYGVANLEHNAPVTARTVFQIQSMTKSFTAAGVLMLNEEGRVKLEDPLSRYVDGAPPEWKGITLRHLLTHTSGLKDYINEPTRNLRLEVTDDEVVRAAAARPLNFEPGGRYEYSNTNYLLLGMVIRRVTGRSYGEFLRERILEPLDMRHTRVYSGAEVIPGRAAGYQWHDGRWWNGWMYAESILGYPGGGLLSTAEDLQKWDLALGNGRILGEETRRLMWSPARLNDGSESSYGFGWRIESISGHPVQSHTGAHSSGFSSAILRLPQDGLSVIVLCNLAGVDAFHLARTIAGQYVPDVLPREDAIPARSPA